MKRLRSSRTRLVLSHVIVAVLAVAVALDILIAQVPVDWINNSESVMAGVEWLMNAPDHSPNPIRNNHRIPGFALVVSPENRVLHSVGNTPCYAEMRLADCAPDLLNLGSEDRYYSEGGQQWWEVTRILSGSERIISRRVLYNGEPSLMIGTTEVRGSLAFLILSSLVGMLVALPFALVLAWLLVRLQTRRLVRLAQVSRRFARGDFSARVLSRRGDIIGALSQQFDSMADALQHNMDGLRTLAGRHRELAWQAEQAAGAAERARVARDLHDTLAQQIFNLSVTASALADSVEQPSPHHVETARQLASRAEDTLVHLRGVLVDLRADAETEGQP